MVSIRAVVDCGRRCRRDGRRLRPSAGPADTRRGPTQRHVHFRRRFRSQARRYVEARRTRQCGRRATRRPAGRDGAARWRRTRGACGDGGGGDRRRREGANEAQREDVVDRDPCLPAHGDRGYRLHRAAAGAARRVEGSRGRRDHQRDVPGNAPGGGARWRQGAGSFPGHRISIGPAARGSGQSQGRHHRAGARQGARRRRQPAGPSGESGPIAASVTISSRWRPTTARRCAARSTGPRRVLAEAIPYDLYVSKRPRHLLFNSTCMDFSDLPSGIGRRASFAALRDLG